MAGKVPFDIIHILQRSPLLVQLVRLGSQWSDDQVPLFLRLTESQKASCTIELPLRLKYRPMINSGHDVSPSREC